MLKQKKKIVVVGAGPGGLAAAMLLAARGFTVDVFEKKSQVGGRNGAIRTQGYTFDIGPTFLMMKFLLDSVFEDAGLNADNYLTTVPLDPMYELRLGDRIFRPNQDAANNRQQIEHYFPGLGQGYDRFMQYERKRFAHMIPCIQRDYSSLHRMIGLDLLKALPYLAFNRSVFDVLKGYFPEDALALMFGFQSKYLGMSAWRCPGAFTMLSYIEHAYGVHHVMGGLNQISAALAKAAEEKGARIHLNRGVRQLKLQGRRVVGVELEDGTEVGTDQVVINADFGHAMLQLVPPGTLKKYNANGLKRRKVSCSTYMLYLGLDRLYPQTHHTIVFANDYQKNVAELFEQNQLSSDISFYVQNASATDPSLAPAGHSTLYILVPVPNTRSGIDWDAAAPKLRQMVFQALEHKLGFKDLMHHIKVERSITPQQWQDEMHVYEGATFNLAHNIGQMAYFRPRNRFEELESCYLVGGGTHPGSGLPTILESARISANLISKHYDVPFITRELVA